MCKFIKVNLVDSSHLYDYVNTSFIYAIEKDGKFCKLVMAGRDEVLRLGETVDSVLARIRDAE